MENIVPLKFRVLPHSNVTDEDFLARSGHRIVLDDKYLYCWGGYNPECWDRDNTGDTEYPLLKELWRYHIWTNRWEMLPTHGDVPTELASHTIMKVGNYIIHFGGTGVPFGQASTNTLYTLDLKTLKWTYSNVQVGEEPADDMPRAKYGHTMTHVGHYAYVVGGTSGYTYDCDVHRLDLQTLQWEEVLPKSQYIPEGRYRHEVVYHAGKLYMFGGGTGATAHSLDKVDVFDIEDKTWESIKTKPHVDHVTELLEYPSGRRCHSCSKYRDYMYMCGGVEGNNIKSDVWKYHLPSHQWTKMSFTVPVLHQDNVPRGRVEETNVSMPIPAYFHAANVSPEGCLFILGGVTRVDDVRTNALQLLWLHLPPLKLLCWKTIVDHLDKDRFLENKETLLQLGIPVQFLETIL